MCFCIFLGDTQVKDVGIQDEPVVRDLEIFYFIMFFGIKDMFTICGQPFTQVNIIGITSQAISAVGFNFYSAGINFFEYS